MVQGAGCMVQGLGCRVQGLGSRVQSTTQPEDVPVAHHGV